MNTIQTTELFDRWFDRLKDRQAKARIPTQQADIKAALKLARDLEG